ncbi:PepSY-associated TM helix domain-containing protein [Oceanobacter antarcticus]|uniref:PepSY-associated TM helix domain-containing protein n=1 Tax=Oceanobacter antarcticus TaxID=3133425 RepID=A0ABW8NKN1_9GAMM
MRSTFVLLHRWAGLTTAAFLFLTGITGAVISWDHELDGWLNSHLTAAHTPGQPQPVLNLVEQLEDRHPNVEVLYFSLHDEPGHAAEFYVQPKLNPATGALYPESFNQVFVDPVSGAELGTRQWGAVWPITRETFVSFLYKLHYSLHLPEMFGTDRWGVWLLGVIALIWTIDSVFGLILTLPKNTARRTARLKANPRKRFWRRWQPAWAIRWNKGGYKLNFDLHQAVSLWTWGLLVIIAFTAFSLNLYREVFHPALSAISDVTPTPYDQRTMIPVEQLTPPALSYHEVLTLARQQADTKGWQEPLGAVFYARQFDLYDVKFYPPESDHGVGGAGHKTLFIDAHTGALLGDRIPWQGTAADIFIQAQFPLHSGRILGLPGRILISAMGLVVAMLSITGVIIWWRKRRARIARSLKGRDNQDKTVPKMTPVNSG